MSRPVNPNFTQSNCRECTAKNSRIGELQSQLDVTTKRLLAATAFWSSVETEGMEVCKAGDVGFVLTCRDEQNRAVSLTQTEIRSIQVRAIPTWRTLYLRKPAFQEFAVQIERDEAKKSFGITFVPVTDDISHGSGALLVRKCLPSSKLRSGDIVIEVDGAAEGMLDRIKRVDRALLRIRRTAHPTFGVNVEALPLENPSKLAVRIVSVDPESPAADAGLMVGDLVTRIGRDAVSDMSLGEIVEILLQSNVTSLSVVPPSSSLAWRLMRKEDPEDLHWEHRVSQISEEQYKLSLEGIPSGSYSIAFTLAGFPFCNEFQTTVEPGIACASRCVIAGGVYKEAEAGVPLSFVIAVCDQYGNRRNTGGDFVEIQDLHGNEPDAEAAEITDHNNGSYTVSWRITTACPARPFFVLVNGLQTREDPYLINVKPAAVSVEHCSVNVSGGEWAVVAGKALSFTVTICDRFGNKRNRGEDKIELRQSQVDLPVQSTPLIRSNLDGTYTVTWEMLKAIQCYPFVIMCGREVISSQEIDIKPADVCLQKCRVEVLGGHWGLTAGDEATLKITVRDEYENRRDRGGDVVAVWDLAAAPGRELNSGSDADVSDHGDGTYTVVWRICKANRAHPFHIMVNHERVSNRPFELDVRPSAVAIDQCSVEVAGGEWRVVASQTLTFNVSVRDQFGNLRNRGKDYGADKVDVQSMMTTHPRPTKQGSNANPVLWSPSVTDNGNGIFTVSWVLTTATRVHPFRILVNDELLSSHDVDVLPAPVSLPNCRVDVDNDSGQWAVVAGDVFKCTITICDTFGNKRNRGGDLVEILDLNEVRGETNVAPEIEDNMDGTYAVSWPMYAATKAHPFHIIINSEKLQHRPFEINVIPASVNLQRCHVRLDSTTVTAGKQLVASIEICDQFGNRRNRGLDAVSCIDKGTAPDGSPQITCTSIGIYTITWTLIKATHCRPIAFYINDELLSSHDINVQPDAVCLTQCGVDVAGGSWTIQTGKVLTMTVTICDEYGNRRDRGTDLVEVMEGKGALVERERPTVIANKDGTYLVQWKLLAANRAFPIRILVNDWVLLTQEVEVVPANAWLSNCSVEVVGGNWSVVAGRLLIFNVTLCDQFGNKRMRGGDQVEIGDLGEPHATGLPAVVDNGDGTFTVSWCLTQATLRHPFEVKVNGLVLSKHEVDVQPGPVALSKCKVESSSETWVVTAGQLLQFKVEVCDEFGNRRDRGMDNIVVQDQGDNTNEEQPVVKAEGSGIYTVLWMLKYAAWAHPFTVYCNSERISTRNFEIGVLPGATCASRCQVYGEGLVSAIAHIPAKFTVCTKDEFGNDIGTGGDLVEVTFVGCAMREDSVTVTDNLNGTYTVVFIAPMGGSLQLYSSVNKQACQSGVVIPVRSVSEWSPDDCALWAEAALGQPELGKEFQMQNLDGNGLLTLTSQQLLSEFRVRDFNTRRRISTAISKLQAAEDKSLAEKLQIGREIGRTNHTVVHQAQCGLKTVAVKSIQIAKASAADLESFIDEAKIVRCCRHPNVVQVLAIMATESGVTIISEFVRGSSLYNLLHVERSSIDPIGIALDVARGVLFLHSFGVQHWDLRSANILVAENGTEIRGQVSDFGLTPAASMLPSFTSMKPAQHVRWAAPEILDDRRAPDREERTDTYSFGMILLELWSRAVPWQEYSGAGSEAQITQLVLTNKRPAVSSSISGALKSLIERCWHDSPKLRPFFTEIVSELDQL